MKSEYKVLPLEIPVFFAIISSGFPRICPYKNHVQCSVLCLMPFYAVCRSMLALFCAWVVLCFVPNCACPVLSLRRFVLVSFCALCLFVRVPFWACAVLWCAVSWCAIFMCIRQITVGKVRLLEDHCGKSKITARSLLWKVSLLGDHYRKM
jgi:hypothetical protein